MKLHHLSEQSVAQDSPRQSWLPAAAWFAALSLALFALYMGWRAFSLSPETQLALDPNSPYSGVAAPVRQLDQSHLAGVELISGVAPLSRTASAFYAIDRRLKLHTVIPRRPDDTVKQYSVDKGDSVFEIAAKFNLKPETVLWANYDQLNDNPDLISVGMSLNIPPVDGVLHVWKEGETIEGVASQYQSMPDKVLNWPGNMIDLVDKNIEAGALVLVPDGRREYRQWIIPTIPRGKAGVSQSLYGGGACEGGYDGAYGSGAFIWPAGNHLLSGNDYWDGHLGLDIAAGEGAPIYAADSGVVVFAGWASGGYGNMVMIDHGNGYQTVYAHLSSVKANCGQSLGQGSILGFSGSTGNSTGAHLHFEVRYQGGFVNPWYVLPAP